MGSSPTRGSSFVLGKVTALGVLCCFALFVCLTLLASFFLPSHLSFKNMHMCIIMCVGYGGEHENRRYSQVVNLDNTVIIWYNIHLYMYCIVLCVHSH